MRRQRELPVVPQPPSLPHTNPERGDCLREEAVVGTRKHVMLGVLAMVRRTRGRGEQPSFQEPWWSLRKRVTTLCLL